MRISQKQYEAMLKRTQPVHKANPDRQPVKREIKTGKSYCYTCKEETKHKILEKGHKCLKCQNIKERERWFRL